MDRKVCLESGDFRWMGWLGVGVGLSYVVGRRGYLEKGWEKE